MRFILFLILILLFLAFMILITWGIMRYRINYQAQKWEEKRNLKNLEWKKRTLEQKIKFRENSFATHDDINELEKELQAVDKIIENIKEKK